MTPSHTAQGIASLGRNGDSMLMHVSPREVQGLQGLAMAQGGSLTINPDTGLPEAFNIGRLFKSFLPAVAGFMLGGPAGAAMGTSATMGGVAAGALTGAAIAGMDGENALLGALTGGLGGYGGAGMAGVAGNAAKLGTTAATQAAGTQAATTGLNVAGTYNPALNSALAAEEVALSSVTPGNIGMANSFPSTMGPSAPFSAGLDNIGMANSFNPIASANAIKPPPVLNVGTGGATPAYDYSKSMGDAGQGLKELAGLGDSKLTDVWSKVGTPVEQGGLGGSKLGIASTLGMPVLQEAMTIDPATMIDTEAIRKAQEDKYRDPITGRLNLSPDSGLRLAAQGGLINSYATGGTVQSGGVRDLYGGPDNQPTMSTGLGGFGLGRLNDLASEQAMNQAKTLGYAMGGLTALKPGGYLSGGGDGMSDSIPATIEGKQPARLADGEFVVPADVVSHLGNGSSKAGSKRLYAMLDKIRHARTGNKKQGKQINPAKYMPA